MGVSGISSVSGGPSEETPPDAVTTDQAAPDTGPQQEPVEGPADAGEPATVTPPEPSSADAAVADGAAERADDRPVDVAAVDAAVPSDEPAADPDPDPGSDDRTSALDVAEASAEEAASAPAPVAPPGPAETGTTGSGAPGAAEPSEAAAPLPDDAYPPEAGTTWPGAADAVGSPEAAEPIREDPHPQMASPAASPAPAPEEAGRAEAGRAEAGSAPPPTASAPPAPTAHAAPRPTGRTRAATRAAARESARASAGADKARAAQRSPRRRRWPVLLVALLAVAALGAGAFLAVDRLRDPDDAVAAEQVPDAVLPELSDPAPALAALSTEAPAPDPGVLAGVLNPLLAAPSLGTGLSAQVADVATGSVLFDAAGTDPGTPASTTKLLTALAALTTLDPESTLTTRVLAGTAPGEVVLVGGGDPTLSTTDPSRAYPGAATITELAARVRAQLAGSPVTRVVVDGSLFSGPLTAPGWQPDDAPSTYAAPVTAVAVDGARVDPDGPQRSGQPGTDAGTALAAALGAPDADVVVAAAPAGARTLGSVESAPVQRLVEQALTDSDNLLAESLARHVALARGLPATFAGAAQAVTDAVAEAGVDTTGLSLVDASGLSDQDRAPARLLVDVVRAASDGSVPEAAGLVSGLPVAGYTGTLSDRTADGAGPGTVRAKTGTLLSVHDLAGTVVTADGRLLAFAVLADATAGSPLASETALDVVAAALASCGCR